MGWMVRGRQLHLSDLIVGQITGGIGRPQITGGCFRSHAEVPATDIQPSAGGAASRYIRSLVFQSAHQRIGYVRPHLAERASANVAEGVMPPKLIGVDGAIPTHATDAAPGAVAFIHLEEFQDFGGPW